MVMTMITTMTIIIIIIMSEGRRRKRRRRKEDAWSSSWKGQANDSRQLRMSNIPWIGL